MLVRILLGDGTRRGCPNSAMANRAQDIIAHKDVAIWRGLLCVSYFEMSGWRCSKCIRIQKFTLKKSEICKILCHSSTTRHFSDHCTYVIWKGGNFTLFKCNMWPGSVVIKGDFFFTSECREAWSPNNNHNDFDGTVCTQQIPESIIIVLSADLNIPSCRWNKPVF